MEFLTSLLPSLFSSSTATAGAEAAKTATELGEAAGAATAAEGGAEASKDSGFGGTLAKGLGNVFSALGSDSGGGGGYKYPGTRPTVGVSIPQINNTPWQRNKPINFWSNRNEQRF